MLDKAVENAGELSERICFKQEDRKNVKKNGVWDGASYAYVIGNISRELVLRGCKRPMSDLQMLPDASFSSGNVHGAVRKY